MRADLQKLPDREQDLGFLKGMARMEGDIQKKRGNEMEDESMTRGAISFFPFFSLFVLNEMKQRGGERDNH